MSLQDRFSEHSGYLFPKTSLSCPGCFKKFQWCFNSVVRLFQKSIKFASSLFQGSFKMRQYHYKDVFQDNFNIV